MQQYQEPTGFFIQKRNIVTLCVWVAVFVALVAGITVNAVSFRNGTITEAEVYRRLLYAVLCFVCVSAIILIEKIFRFEFSLFVEISLICFAFIALGGGTVFSFYKLIPNYDKILHTLSGPLFSIVGLEFADVLTKDQPLGKRKVAAFICIAFFFSLAIGYLWEVFEYSVDTVIVGYNNQGWQQGLLEELPDGTFLVTDRRGTGLLDTMADLICNLIGTVVFLIPTLIACLVKPEGLNIFRLHTKEKKKKSE